MLPSFMEMLWIASDHCCVGTPVCRECDYNMVVKNAARKHIAAVHVHGDISMDSTCCTFIAI